MCTSERTYRGLLGPLPPHEDHTSDVGSRKAKAVTREGRAGHNWALRVAHAGCSRAVPRVVRHIGLTLGRNGCRRGHRAKEGLLCTSKQPRKRTKFSKNRLEFNWGTQLFTKVCVQTIQRARSGKWSPCALKADERATSSAHPIDPLRPAVQRARPAPRRERVLT